MEIQLQTEFGHGTGSIPSGVDSRDYLFTPRAGAAPFDWEVGFDIELLIAYRFNYCKSEADFFGSYGREGWGATRYKEIHDFMYKKPVFKIWKKDQNGSFSCTGQAISQYAENLNAIETGQYVKLSAKDMYNHCSWGKNQGSTCRQNLDRLTKIGIASEFLVPSYQNGQPANEDFYLSSYQDTSDISNSRITYEAKAYAQVTRDNYMDQFAWAMLLNFGTYFGVGGHNGGAWNTEDPQVAKDTPDWFHALYGGKAGLRNGKPAIATPNSWGYSFWQWLNADWFNPNQYNNALYEAWTAVDLSNDISLRKGVNMEFYLIAGEKTVVIKDATGKYYPIATPPALWPYVQQKYNLSGNLPQVSRAEVDANTGGQAIVDIYIKSN